MGLHQLTERVSHIHPEKVPFRVLVSRLSKIHESSLFPYLGHKVR